MSGDRLDKYRRVRRAPADDEGGAFKPGEHPVAPEWVGECLRIAGDAAPPAVVLRQRGGTRTALAYGYLSAVTIDPSGSVDAEFVGHRAAIKGRRLGLVFDALAGQRAMEIAESTGLVDEGGDAPFIETIAIVATSEH